MANVPDRWRAYRCSEYFADAWWREGYFDELSQTLVVVPLEEAYEDAQAEFFAIGRSGADGIDFGFRKHHDGLWALYPIERDFKFMASTVAQLVEEWCAGKLWV